MDDLVMVNPDNYIGASPYFKWREAIYVNNWDVYVYPNKIQYSNISKLVKRLDAIRKMLDAPFIVTSWLRPTLYNQWAKPYGVSGSQFSCHMDGSAIDFQVKGMTADKAREIIVPHLEFNGLRMENLPGSNWVHIDTKTPGAGGRFFKP